MTRDKLMNQKAKYLSAAVALAMGMTAMQAQANDDGYKKIGDLEIYRAAEQGAGTITMMLDMSGSMGTCGTNAATRVQTYYITDEDGNRVNEVTNIHGQKVNIAGGITAIFKHCGGRLERLSELKKAMLDVVSDGTKISEKYKIGIGTFPAIGNQWGGRINIPAHNLTADHRYRIMQEVVSLNAAGATPSAYAFAEVGAYMMGTNTASITGTTPRTAFLEKGRAIYGNPANAAWHLYACNILSNDLDSGLTAGAANGYAGWYTCGGATSINVPNPTPAGFLSTRNYSILTNPDFGALGVGLFGDVSVAQTGNGKTVDLTSPTLTADARRQLLNGLSNPFGDPTRQVRFGEQIEYKDQSNTNANSGFRVSGKGTKTSDLTKYQSPIDAAQCDGYGIYFLTDGEPNGANRDVASQFMGRSLNYPNVNASTVESQFGITASHQGNNQYIDSINGMTSSGALYPTQAYWAYMGGYAKKLRDSSNPSGQEIKTATVGFGDVFAQNVGTKPYTYTDGEGKAVTIQVTNCDAYTSVDARNLCKLGTQGYGFGEGGFTATSSADAVAESVVRFVGNLKQEISTSPAGTISIPRDPLSVDSLQPYAYLPMIQPEVGKNLVTWAGNLKKYHTIFGTLYGQGNARLYVPNSRNVATAGNANFPAALNPNAMDIWQTGASTGNNASVDAGGSRSQLKNPTTSNKANVRTVYVEKRTIVGGNVTGSELVKVGTDGTRLIGFDNLGDEYGIVDRAYILNFLGFSVPVEMDAYVISGQDNSAAALTQRLVNELARAQLINKPVMGGVLHSVPVLASYSGELDTATGNITTDESRRQDHLLYGSMDGAVHLVEARTGGENFSFIPRAIFDDVEQVKALKLDNTYDRIGQPKFGVDAPWSTKAVYEYKDSKMTAKEMYAYGGLRMGGVGLYGLNITDRNNPRLMFSINNQTRGFERLGQTWSKPLEASVLTPQGQRDVLIFGGGYDMCYENPMFTLDDSTNKDPECAGKSRAQGNAVYMIDAKTGQHLKTWTASAATATSGQFGTSSDDSVHMKHSITGEIVGLDRNNNGHVDSLYFGDLGGQLFRIDLQEGAAAGSTRRVVRVFDSNAGAKGAAKGALDSNHIPFRFYEKPEISFYDHENARLAMINIATGDRSSPAHKRRSLNDANRFYGIIDRDLATSAVASNTPIGSLTSRNLTNDSLNFYDTAELETATAAKRKELMDALKTSKKQGWFYKMDNFDGRAGIKHLKSVGPGTVLGGIYYASVYSPDYNYVSSQSCHASVAGGTERQMFCLPWGICANSSGTLVGGSTNGKLGYMKAGPGIQELAVTSVTNTANTSTNIRALIGMQTIAERKQPTNRNDGAGGGSPFSDPDNQGSTAPGSGADAQQGDVAVENTQVLQVKRWYDLQTAEEN